MMETLNPWLVRYRNSPQTKIRLFCLHFAGGSALAFKRWAEQLPEFIELIAVQLPGRDRRYAEPLLTQMDAVITQLSAAITPYLDKPYIVFGHSLGALTGYELLHKLTVLNQPLPRLFIPSAYRAPHLPARAQTLYQLPDAEFLQRLAAFEGTSQLVLENEELMTAFLPRLRADFEILETYQYQTKPALNIPILALLGQTDTHVNEAELSEWAAHTTQFRYQVFNGGHFFIENAESLVLELLEHECASHYYHHSAKENKMLAYVFPGQGSQKKGMGQELFAQFPHLVAQADAILGYSIQTLCLEDPHNQLNQTQYTQPALYVVNALSYEAKVRDSGELPAYCAGHSLGEYSALYAAGAISFETGLKLVQKRGELMSQAKEGAMAAVLKINEASLKQCLQTHQLNNITIANYNSTLQLVISGAKQEIAQAKAPLEAAGALFFPLKTSGAFHSPYMEAAKQTFSQFIQSFQFNHLRCPVIANITAQPYQQAAIGQTLVEQITHPVQWQSSIEYLLRQGVTQFVEIGPGTVLTKLVEQIKTRFTETAHTSPLSSAPASPPSAAQPQNLYQRIQQWNYQYPVGTKVQVKGYAELLETQTEALILFGHRAAIYLKNYNGYFDLDDVMPMG